MGSVMPMMILGDEVGEKEHKTYQKDDLDFYFKGYFGGIRQPFPLFFGSSHMSVSMAHSLLIGIFILSIKAYSNSKN